MKLLKNTITFFYRALNLLFETTNRILKYSSLLVTLLIIIILATIVLMIRNQTNVGTWINKVLQIFGIASNTGDNTIAATRKQPLGVPDSQGIVQYKVGDLETSHNPFRDKTVVTLPDGSKVKLPDGIKDTDIDTIIKTQTEAIIALTPKGEEKIGNLKTVISNNDEFIAKMKAKLNE